MTAIFGGSGRGAGGGRLVLAALLWLLAPASQAEAIYLQISGIPGESTTLRHSKWIEAQSFRQGVARASTNAKPVFHPLSIGKLIDRSSPLLAVACAGAKPIKSATLEVTRATSDALRFLQVKLGLVTITRWQQSGQAGDLPSEQVMLDFATAEWTYTVIGTNGLPVTNIVCSWDRRTGTGVGGDAMADTDLDGLPDDYERFYQLNPAVADAEEDLDGDGLSNLDEFRAGTMPDRSDSVFRLQAVRAADGPVTLRWEPVPGKTYRLLAAPSIEGPYSFVRFLDDREGLAGELAVESMALGEFFVLELD